LPEDESITQGESQAKVYFEVTNNKLELEAKIKIRHRLTTHQNSNGKLYSTLMNLAYKGLFVSSQVVFDYIKKRADFMEFKKITCIQLS
jgi:hypothetical protein